MVSLRLELTRSFPPFYQCGRRSAHLSRLLYPLIQLQILLFLSLGPFDARPPFSDDAVQLYHPPEEGSLSSWTFARVPFRRRPSWTGSHVRDAAGSRDDGTETAQRVVRRKLKMRVHCYVNRGRLLCPRPYARLSTSTVQATFVACCFRDGLLCVYLSNC